jgi:hypothetical protein
MAEPISEAGHRPEFSESAEESDLAISSYGRSFHIDYYSRKDDYRGRIALLGSDRKRVLKGVDAAAIADFIIQNLPPLTRDGAPYFEEINFVQLGRVMAKGETLRAWKHFCIHVHLNLSSAQMADALDDSERTYAVQAWVLSAGQSHVVASNAEGNTLQPRLDLHEITLEMGGLKPAEYVIKIQLILPFNHVKKSTMIGLQVEP